MEPFIKLFLRDGTHFHIAGHEEPSIDATYCEFLSRGKTQDNIIELEDVNGASFKCALSSICSWILLDEEAIRKGVVRDIELDKFIEQVRQEQGIFPSDGEY